jgi:hypothetical protein
MRGVLEATDGWDFIIRPGSNRTCVAAPMQRGNDHQQQAREVLPGGARHPANSYSVQRFRVTCCAGRVGAGVGDSARGVVKNSGPRLSGSCMLEMKR